MGKITKNLLISGNSLVIIYCIMKAIAKKNVESPSIDDNNPHVNHSITRNSDGRVLDGRFRATFSSDTQTSIVDTSKSRDETEEERVDKPDNTTVRNVYESKIKPLLDQVLSFTGLILLSPLFGLIALAVYIDDPGPVFFTQKRIGKDKTYFMCHKFRSMRMSTPHDIPTHQLEDPDQYITRVGRVLRKASLDELPQIWDIFRQRMSVIGPRPALWNQNDLIILRSGVACDGIDANSVMPGLTGLAQIKGRDELELEVKAEYDREYTRVLKKGGIAAFWMDAKCLMKTVLSVLKSDGVVEGGTGTLFQKEDMKMQISRPIEKVRPEEVGFDDYGFKKEFNINREQKVNVLITGKNSYIGENFKTYCEIYYPNIECITIDMEDSSWRADSFKTKEGEVFDTVFHVAGIAHADIGKVNKTEQEKYYEVNTDLAIECCRKAKEDGVKQFIFMSSMIIYGDKDYISEKTLPQPSNFYGNSKWLADKGVRELQCDNFKVCVLRPPMIYGRGSKGNYPTLAKIAKNVSVFPDVENKRSMLYIENLCEFVGQLVCSGEGGVYFPQNSSYSNTSQLVRMIGVIIHKNIHLSKMLIPAVKVVECVPIRKIRDLASKAFGSSWYEMNISKYKGIEYQKYSLEESIKYTEN